MGEDGAEGKGSGKGSKKGGGGAAAATAASPPACTMKYLTPEVLASAIIGKGGATIAAMRQNCQAKLALTEHGDLYPNTDSRVFTTQAETPESLLEVAKQLVAKTVEVAKTGGSEVVGTESELKLRTLVPRAAVGGIIGKSGGTIKQLRESTSAKISIGDPLGSGPSAEQIVTITGTAKALETVLKEVNTQVQNLNSESWFPTWSAPSSMTQSTMGGGSYSGSGYPGMSMRGGGPGVDVMMRVAHGLPPYVMEDSRGFALSCVVPNKLVGGLIGRHGAGTKEVQALTGTQITIRPIPGDSENQSMNITGPLANTCAGYMMMMKRYLDAEAASSSSS